MTQKAALLLSVCLLSILKSHVGAWLSGSPTARRLKAGIVVRSSAPRPTDDDETEPIKNDSWKDQLTKWIIRRVLDQMKNSDMIQEQHERHVESNQVLHLFQSTPLAKLDDELKIKFISSPGGQLLQQIMAEEQEYLMDWKVSKIIEAANGKNNTLQYNSSAIQEWMQQQHESYDIVMYSFVDCPWCIAAKRLLVPGEESDARGGDASLPHPYSHISVKIFELESLQQKGKQIRAELAKQTQRTSLPSIWVRGHGPIGGYTDGSPIGPGLLPMHESGELRRILPTRPFQE